MKRGYAIWIGALASCVAFGCARERASARTDAEAQTQETAPPRGALRSVTPESKVTALSVALTAFNPPAELHFPDGLSSDERVPLLLLLHGFGVPSTVLIAKARLADFAAAKRFAYVVPNGNRNAEGRDFWNAGPSCCDTDKSGVDDVARLSALLEAASAAPHVDTDRVYVVGYSNGGFMAQRLACELGDRLAAVISVAGAAPAADSRCVDASGLAILEIHGRDDPFVRYEGGTVLGRSDFAPHPSAPESMRWWATRLGCAGSPKKLADRDLEPGLPGAETQVERYEDCQGDVELWSVRGGQHYVALQQPAFDAMWEFLAAHPRTRSTTVQ